MNDWGPSQPESKRFGLRKLRSPWGVVAGTLGLFCLGLSRWPATLESNGEAVVAYYSWAPGLLLSFATAVAAMWLLASPDAQDEHRQRQTLTHFALLFGMLVVPGQFVYSARASVDQQFVSSSRELLGIELCRTELDLRRIHWIECNIQAGHQKLIYIPHHWGFPRPQEIRLNRPMRLLVPEIKRAATRLGVGSNTI